MNIETLNVSSGSLDWRAHALSNFPCFPFVLDRVAIASAEGFIQGIKFPQDDPRRQEAFRSWGKNAKRIGESASREHVWWNDCQLPYNSPAHRDLIERAIVAKFSYNEGARLALISTGDIVLVHDVEPESPFTSLPAAVFCRILTDIRTQLRTQL